MEYFIVEVAGIKLGWYPVMDGDNVSRHDDVLAALDEATEAMKSTRRNVRVVKITHSVVMAVDASTTDNWIGVGS